MLAENRRMVSRPNVGMRRNLPFVSKEIIEEIKSTDRLFNSMTRFGFSGVEAANENPNKVQENRLPYAYFEIMEYIDDKYFEVVLVEWIEKFRERVLRQFELISLI